MKTMKEWYIKFGSGKEDLKLESLPDNLAKIRDELADFFFLNNGKKEAEITSDEVDLVGYVFGCSKFKDGDYIATSPIRKIELLPREDDTIIAKIGASMINEKRYCVTTQSGTEYTVAFSDINIYRKIMLDNYKTKSK